MIRLLYLEFYKLRHRKVFLTTVLFLCVEMAWAFTATSISISRNPEQAEWNPLISMLSSMNGLFLPILCAVVVSRICDMEHKGDTWKLLFSVSVNPKTFYGAKYFASFIIMLCIAVLQAILVTVFGITYGFERLVPFFLLIRFIIGIVSTNMVVIALQQWISIVIKNQAFALCFGMIGGFIGLTADLFPVAIRRFFLWSYYTGLSPIKQIYTGEKIEFIVCNQNELLLGMVTLVTVGIAVYIIGSLHLSKQEV